MANVTLSSPAYFYKGNSGASAYVGYDEDPGTSRPVRYSFVAPKSGLFDISLAVQNVSKNAGFVYVDIDKALLFQISEGEKTYATTVGETDGCATPTITVTSSSSGSITATIRYKLVAGQTYYLWLYPSESYWHTYYFGASSASAELKSLGIITLKTASGLKNFQPTIFDSSSGQWKAYAPFLRLNSAWEQMGGKE